MKKLLLGLFLLVSALSFSAERKISSEQMIIDQDTEIIYAQGEKTPYTGIVEFRYENGKIQGLMGVKNGVLDGKGITYYPSGKIQSKENIESRFSSKEILFSKEFFVDNEYFKYVILKIS